MNLQRQYGDRARLAYFPVCCVWPGCDCFALGSSTLANDPRLLGQAARLEEAWRTRLGNRVSHFPIVTAFHIRWLCGGDVVD